MGAYLVYRQSESFLGALEYAMAAALLTLMCESTVVQDLNQNKVKQLHDLLKFVRKDLC
jgi:hypothetical protein